ncbi:MAG: FAD-dependent oxidoreductase [Chlamydiota bacterium]
MNSPHENPGAKRIVVLGAGLAGLSAAYELARAGYQVTVIEKCSEIGGMAKSLRRGEFTCDLGPHRFYSSKQDPVNHVKGLMGDRLALQERKSTIYLRGKRYDYPLKVGNVVRNMPPKLLVRIILDYALIRVKDRFRAIPDDSFEHWVVKRFGWTLYDIYFREYTEKTWGLSCSDISADWAAQRISLLGVWDTIKKTIFKTRNVARTYISRFFYPTGGGIGEIANAYGGGIESMGARIICNCTVDRIVMRDASRRVSDVVLSTDQGPLTLPCDHLLSTIPLTELVQLIKPAAGAPVISAVGGLNFRSIIFVFVIIARDRFSEDHWIYLPERRFRANRISESKNFNIRNAPPGKTVLCAEITCTYGDAVWGMTDDALEKAVVGDLVDVGHSILQKEEVLESFIHRMKHAYPIYEIGYKEKLAVVDQWLGEIDNLHYFGRNALFRYNNMDQSIDMGLIVARDIIEGKRDDFKHVGLEQQWFG